VGTTTYTYDAADRLTQEGNTTYTYNANGSRLTKTLSGSTTNYSYDFDEQLVQVGEQWDVAWFYDEGATAQAKMPYALLDRFFYRPNDSLHLDGGFRNLV
jgi:uncharacterized protein RhaS with RHS repeats